MPNKKAKIAVAHGDGIGPEIMAATLDVLKAAGARLDLHEVVVGEKAYDAGEAKGISDDDFKVLESCDAFLKAPLSTPQGKGYSSVNVAIRKYFDLFTNIRPSVSLEPVIKSKSDDVDMVIIRENIEDLYIGKEYRPTPDTVIGRKVITRSETDRIIRTAFEYARSNSYPKVTGMAKDNIQKFTDGLFHDVLDEVAKDYPDIETEFYIVDIGTARLGAKPEDFDAVVTQNMYGDIGSDVVSEALGSVGLSGSANIGEKFAMFEAIHGTAPNMAGQNTANPSGLLMAAVMMLNYIGQNDVAEKIHNAWLVTLEDGIHTKDVYQEEKSGGWLSYFKSQFLDEEQNYSRERAGTSDFAKAVIERLGRMPKVLKPVDYSSSEGGFQMPEFTTKRAADQFITTGIDVDVAYSGSPVDLANIVQPLLGADAKLKEIQTVRGDVVWPDGKSSFYNDYKTLRIEFDGNACEFVKKAQAVDVLSAFSKTSGVNWRESRFLTKNARTLENNYR